MNLLANEGEWDRAVRVAVGAALLYLGWGGLLSGAAGLLVSVAGFLALATGIVAWCPAYSVCGISTRRVTDDDCVACGEGSGPEGGAWRR